MYTTNTFLEKTDLTSTENKYLNEDKRQKEASLYSTSQNFQSTRFSNVFGKRKYVLDSNNLLPEAKQRRITLLSIENKFLNPFNWIGERARESAVKFVPTTHGKKPKAMYRSAAVKTCEEVQFPVRQYCDDDRVDKAMQNDFILGSLNSCEGLDLMSSTRSFGAPCASAFASGDGLDLVGSAVLFGAPRSSAPVAFGFGGVNLNSILPPAKSLMQQRRKTGTRQTHFSSVHGMPVYQFKSIEILEPDEPEFSSLEASSELLQLKKIQCRKLKKVQLLNATSMALIYSPNFKDPGDAFRLFLLKCAEDVAQFDPEFILKVALYARQELHIRTASNFLLSYSAFNVATRPYLHKYFEKSIILPTDWIDVAEQYLNFDDSRLKKRSLPTALKYVMKKTFKKFDAYQLAKYNRNKSKSSSEKLSLESSDESSTNAGSKTLKTFTLKQLIRLLHISSPVDHVMCLLGKKYPKDSEEFRKCGLSGTWDSKRAGQRMKLPIPETWETKVSSMGNNAEVWETLIDNSKLPYMAMLRNLKNLIMSGISEEHHETVLSRLADKHAVISSKQFPIQFYSAYKVFKDIESALYSEEEEQPISTVRWKRKRDEKNKERMENICPFVLDSYEKAMSKAVEISAMNNLDPIPGKTLVICDVMNPIETCGKNSSKGAKAYHSCIILGVSCLKACEDCKMKVLFGNDSVETVQMSDEPFLETVSDICSKCETGIEKRKDMLLGEENIGDFKLVCRQSKKRSLKNPNTSFSEDFLFDSLRLVLDYYLKPQTILTQKLDNLILLRCSSDVDSTNVKTMMTSFLTKYRQTVNSDLLYTHVDLTLTDRSYPDLNSSTGKDTYLSGMSNQLLKFIAERSEGGQLSYVDNIDKKFKLSDKREKERFQMRKKNKAIPDALTTVPLYSNIPKWHTVRIFISSTFKDMHAERDLLVRYVMPELKIRAASIFVKINEVDLRWGITEADCATKRAAELCLLQAQKSDLFIGILGERYGSIYNFEAPDNPELQWVKDYSPGSSITELEMYSGALKDDHSSSKAFFYFRDASFISYVPPMWSEHFQCESLESKFKLDNLKQKIRSSGVKLLDGYPCYYAGAVNNNKNPVVAGLDTFGEKVLADLWKAVGEIHNKEPYLDEVREEEISQHDLFETNDFYVSEKNIPIDLFLSNLKKSTGTFVVSGTSGCGKTAFVIDLLRKIENSSVIKFFIGVSPRSTDLSYMLQYIADVISRQFPVSSLFPTMHKDIVIQFPDILLEAVKVCSTNDFTLVIDGLNHLSVDDQRLDWLPPDIPEGMRLICFINDKKNISGHVAKF